MTIQDVEKNHLVYKALVGSKAYGLDTPESDEDYRGVFIPPLGTLKDSELGAPQINDDKHDITYYSIDRFTELLIKNNPNILEMLYSPIVVADISFLPIIAARDGFLSKKVANTFSSYATSQIKKARGLKKKIVNEMSRDKKTPLDFCYYMYPDNGHTIPITKWLKSNDINQELIGLASVSVGHQIYKMYYSPVKMFKGIIKENSNELRLSSIPKDTPLVGFLIYNMNGYSSYCKEYKEYWDWVEHRNPERYKTNISHNQNYDSKNMQHCIRLLDQAIDILENGTINIVHPNKDLMFLIKKGVYSYDEIMDMVNKRLNKIKILNERSSLRDDVSKDDIISLISQVKKDYQLNKL